MAGLSLDDLQTWHTEYGTGPFLQPPAGMSLGPIDLAASVNSLQQNLVQYNQILGAMKNAFVEQMSAMQLTHAQELQRLQHEQQRLHQDDLNLHNRLGASPGTSSPTALRIDCPLFDSEDGGADMKIGLHEFHTWRVQAMAWYSECTMTFLGQERTCLYEAERTGCTCCYGDTISGSTQA